MESEFLKSNKISIGELAVVGLILTLPFLILWPFGDVLFPINSPYSDLAIAHLPPILDIRYTLSHFGHIPLWSNTTLSGTPLISDPLSSIWYPPLWLTWFLPLPASLNLLVIVHLIMAELGLFLFLKQKGLHSFAALTGALMVGFSPKVLGQFAGGHVTLMLAYAWTPWLLLFFDADEQISLKKQGISALILAFIILADLRWAAYAGLLYAGYALYAQLGRGGSNIKNGILWLKKMLLQCGVAALVCFPYLFLVLQYSALSTRSQMGVSEQLTLSLPPIALLGIVFPDMGGYFEWITYGGALVLPVLIHIIFLKKNVRFWFWPLVFVASIIFALGIRPVADILLTLPGLNLLRVPSRALFVALIAVSISTAQLLDVLAKNNKEERIANTFFYNLLIFGCAAFALLVATGMAVYNRNLALEFLWGAGFLLLYLMLFVLKDRLKLRAESWLAMVIVLLVLDLAGVNVSLFRHESYEAVINQGRAAAEMITAAGKEGRVYSPSYSLPQQSAAYYRLNQSDGINPLQLKVYDDYLARAGGFVNETYSVTLPPYESGVPGSQYRNAPLDAAMLGKLNVRYVLSAFEVKQPGFIPVGNHGTNLFLYENLLYQPEAVLQNESDTLPLVLQKEGDDRLSLQVEGPGELILSEIAYPGWKIFVDGAEKAYKVKDGLFLQLQLEAGRHEVSVLFCPDILWMGLTISLIAIILYIIMVVWFDRKKRT